MNNYQHDKITPTADLISYFRIFSDTPYVKEIAEMTDAEKTAKDILGENFNGSSFLAVMAEARYKRIDIQARRYRNILEVAVGRSPRGLIFTEDPQVNYVATDLPQSLEQYRTIIKELMRRHDLQRPNLHFAPANALNYDELRVAAELLPDGPLAIISEGFMPYLPKEEKRTFLGNVFKIISKRGGSLITSDVNYAKRSHNRLPGMFESLAVTAGRDMRDLSFDDEPDARNFFSEAGFTAETFSDAVDVVSMKELGLEDDSQSQRVMNFPIWILKPKQ